MLTNVEPNDVLRRIESALAAADAPVSGRVFESSVVLKMHPADTRFWSPQLQLSIDPHLPSGSVVHGLFGPRPTIWGLFVALYTAIGFSAVMGVIFGYSKLTLGESGSALWSGPMGIVAAVTVYVIGRIGRRLGMDQMGELKSFLEGTLA